jgi:hypothetical protein
MTMKASNPMANSTVSPLLFSQLMGRRAPVYEHKPQIHKAPPIRNRV